MQSILGQALELSEVANRYVPQFARSFARKMVLVSEGELGEKLKRHAGETTVA
jgi:hypothetical protein